MNAENTTATLDDLLAEEEEQFTNAPVNLRTGIAGNKTRDRAVVLGERPNATRWLFSPYEVIDLRNEPTSCGIDWIRNVVFNKIKSIPVNVAKKDVLELPAVGHNEDNYEKFMRTALMVATELVSKNGDKGVIMITDILGEDDEIAADLNSLLFGDEVYAVSDLEHPEHPCPVLPRLLESLDENVRRSTSAMTSAEDQATRTTVISVARAVRSAIVLAMRNARTRIDIAQKRILDEKNPNRNLSPGEQRCYLALGLEIPNVMPFLTQTAAQNLNNNQGGGIDFEAMGRGIGQTIAAAQGGVVPVATADLAESPFTPGVPLAPVSLGTGASDETATDFEVSEADLDALLPEELPGLEEGEENGPGDLDEEADREPAASPSEAPREPTGAPAPEPDETEREPAARKKAGSKR